MLLGKQVSTASIAKIRDVSCSTLLHFIRSRALVKARQESATPDDACQTSQKMTKLSCYSFTKESLRLPSLFEEIRRRLTSGEYEEVEEEGTDGIVRGYRWRNGLPLNKSHPDSRVNYLDDGEILEGKESNFSWITDLKLCRDNVYLVMRRGCGRWKIENETFNTLKHQGYQLEHNDGHGQKHLTTVFGLLMMLAFLVDQVQELCCNLFQAVRQQFRSRTSLWDKLRGLFKEYFIVSWESL